MDRRTAIASILAVTGASCRASFSDLFSDNVKAGPVAKAQPALRSTKVPGFTSVTTAQIPIGGGGFVTGIDQSADGRRWLSRTDVANAYLRDRGDTAWRPLFSTSSMLQDDYDSPLPADNKGDGDGVAGIRLAPSDPDTIYASYRGYIWVSRDGGRSIRRTRLSQKRMYANSGRQRLHNRSIDVHPRDSQTVLVGTWGEGVWFSRDAGTSWKRIPLPEASRSLDDQPGLNLVAIDPRNPERIHVFVTGSGLFTSTSGLDGRFAQMPGGPSYCSSMVLDWAGNVCLCETTKGYQGGAFWRFSANQGWLKTPLAREALVAAIDPHQNNRIILIDPDGFFLESRNAGQSFDKVGGGAYVEGGGEVRWMGGLVTIYPAEAVFDRSSADTLWVAQGVGVAKVVPTGSKYQIADWSSGIEELCAVSALCVPKGKTILTSWDKPFWIVDDFQSYANDFSYPAMKGFKRESNFVGFASSVDYASNDPNLLVGIVAPTDRSAPGLSRDGGRTWQAFDGIPDTGWGHGGCIAANGSDNYVLLPSNNGVGVITNNGGKSWLPIKLNGTTPTDRFSNAFYVNRKNVSADKTRAGTFALVYTVIQNDVFGNPLGGVWLTKDGGLNWTQILKGVISEGSHDPRASQAQGIEARQFWQCQFEFVPGRTGELVYTPHADGIKDPFFWSSDSGATWSTLHRDVRNVRSFSFGKSLPGQERPALFFWGDFKGLKGLYVSFDWFASAPRLITRFPSPLLAQVSCLAGDPDRFGRVIVGTSCGGWVTVEVEV